MTIKPGSSNTLVPVRTQALPQAKTEAGSAEVEDRVSFSFPAINAKGALLGAGLGVLPVVGAATNFGLGIEAQFNGKKAEMNTTLVGFFSNLAGSATLTGGLLFGNQIATNAGLALLGISGLTAAYAGAV